jgi:3',5'-cyclic AMP phosphodiesterase CpdA
MLRIAHVSDLHLLSPDGVKWQSLLNKRLTGYLNLRWNRHRKFRRDYLESVLAAAARDADHVVVTGDVSNLSLEGEFAEGQRLIEAMARTVEVTVIPGNHDAYLPKVISEKSFSHHFDQFVRSDLPSLAIDLPAGRFPCVKLRGPVAIIAMSSAVARPPFVSSGHLGHAQLNALKQILAHAEVIRRTPVILIHHEPYDLHFRIEQLRSGLVDAEAFRGTLRDVPRGLVLFGHLHIRGRSRLQTHTGAIEAVCAGAAGLDSADDRIQAGFNLYTLLDNGEISSIEAWVMDPATRSFRRRDIPTVPPARRSRPTVRGLASAR